MVRKAQLLLMWRDKWRPYKMDHLTREYGFNQDSKKHSQLAVNPMREVWVRQKESLGLAYGERRINNAQSRRHALLGTLFTLRSV
jgi:hypothetical protein